MGLILKIKGPRFAEVGEGVTNKTRRVLWQRMCTFRRTCGYCAQFHGVIHSKDGRVPRLYLHSNCECSDIPYPPGERFARTPSFDEWTQESPAEDLEQMFGKTLGRLVKAGEVKARDITHRDGWDSLTRVLKDQGITRETLVGLDINKATISRVLPKIRKIPPKAIVKKEFQHIRLPPEDKERVMAVADLRAYLSDRTPLGRGVEIHEAVEREIYFKTPRAGASKLPAGHIQAVKTEISYYRSLVPQLNQYSIKDIDAVVIKRLEEKYGTAIYGNRLSKPIPFKAKNQTEQKIYRLIKNKLEVQRIAGRK